MHILITSVDLVTPTNPTPLDFSKATNLKDVEVWSDMPDIQWITKSLQSIEFKNLQHVKITVNPPYNIVRPMGEMIRRELADLDRLLVKLWTSHSLIMRVRSRRVNGETLLPEITSKEGVHVLKAQ